MEEEEENERKELEKLKHDFKEFLAGKDIYQFNVNHFQSIPTDRRADLKIGIRTALNTLENIYFQEDTLLALPSMNMRDIEQINFDFFKNFVDILKNENFVDIFHIICQPKNNDIHLKIAKITLSTFNLESLIHNCQKLDRSLNQIASTKTIYSQLELFGQRLDDQYTEKYAEIQSIEPKVKTIQEEIKSKQEEIETNTKAIKEEIEALYSKAGITSFSKDYHNIAEEERKAKNVWLVVAGICGILAVGVALITLYQLLSPEKTVDFMEYFKRLPWALFLVVSALWTAHKYSVARHNHLIYRHLATTLSTFKAFERPDDKEYQSLLLFEIAKVLFPPPVNKQSENQRELSNMIDLVKTISAQDAFKIKP